MGQNVILLGMVLNAMPMGEYDRRVTVLTRERGKITAFARGSRRPTSQLLAATTPFSFGEFEVFQGRSTYHLVKASISNYFGQLSKDPLTACYGFYFLEVADFFGQENNDDRELLKLLYQSLRALEKDTIDNRLVRRVFELRVLLTAGEYPNFFSCQQCKKGEKLAFFSLKRQGMLCEDCASGEDAMPVDQTTLYALQYVLSEKLSRLYTFAVSEEVFFRFEKIVDAFFSVQVPHKFQSLEILKTIAG